MKTSAALIALLILALLPSCGKKPEIKTPPAASDTAKEAPAKSESPATKPPANSPSTTTTPPAPAPVPTPAPTPASGK